MKKNPSHSSIGSRAKEDADGEKKTAASLRADATRFRVLFDDAPVGVGMAASDGRFLAVNDRFCALVGYSREELLRCSFADITHPDDLKGRDTRSARLVRSEIDHFTLEKRYIRKDGAIVWARINSCLVRDVEPGEQPYELAIIEDITAQKAAETALAESEERLRLAQVAANSGVWDYDLRTGTLSWTAPQYRLFGLDPETFGPVSYDTWRSRVHPDDIAEQERKLRAAIASRSPYDSEFRVVHPEGIRWLIARSKVICDDTGAPLRMIGINLDITERREIEEELRERNVELETVLDAVPAAVLIAHGREGRVVTMNRAASALLRLPQDQNISLMVPESERPHKYRVMINGVEVPPDELPLHRAASTGSEVRGYEEDLVFDNGDVRHVFGNAAPLRGAAGELRGAVGTFIDITDLEEARKVLAHGREALERIIVARTSEISEANERLGREKEFTETLLASTTDGIFAIDRELRFTLWNAAMERISGMSAARVLGRVATEAFPFIIGSKVEIVLKQVVEGTHSIVRDQPYEVPETGRHGYYDCDYAPLRDSNGNVTGAVGIVRETTERRVMEQQLRQAQKMEAVGQLTGGVAHDFNNLLTVVVGSLELIERRSGADDKLRRLAVAASRAAERGARLTEQLLAFSREQTLRPETVDLRGLVRNFENMLERAVGETIELSISAEVSLWPCRIDHAQFETAMLNLVLNARDAMPMGGTLTIDMRNVRPGDEDARRVELASGSYVKVAVADTGMGMSPETVQRAFEPFFTTKEVGKGTGLGLSMVYGFVKQSGGHIAIDSATDGGTRIVLYLPRADEVEPTGVDDASGRNRVPEGTETIVVTEDDAAVGEVVAAMLDNLGYRVLSARTGREALGILESDPGIDLLLTDVVMPGGISGVELAREARRLRPEIAVLLISGYAERVLTAQQAHDEFPILPKPLHRVPLAHMLRTLLDRPGLSRPGLSRLGKQA